MTDRQQPPKFHQANDISTEVTALKNGSVADEKPRTSTTSGKDTSPIATTQPQKNGRSININPLHPGEHFLSKNPRYNPTYDTGTSTQQPSKPISNQEISHSPEPPGNDTGSTPATQTEEAIIGNLTPIGSVNPLGPFGGGSRSRYGDPNYNYHKLTPQLTPQASESITHQGISSSTDQTNAAQSIPATQSSETVGANYTEQRLVHSGKPFNDRTSTPPAPNNNKFTTQVSEPNNSQTISKQPDANPSIASIAGTQISGKIKILSDELEKIAELYGGLNSSGKFELGTLMLIKFVNEKINKSMTAIYKKIIPLSSNRNTLNPEEKRTELEKIQKELNNPQEKINLLIKEVENEMLLDKYKLVSSEYKEELIARIKPIYEKENAKHIETVEKQISRNQTHPQDPQLKTPRKS